MNMVVCWFSLRGINCSLSDGFHYKVASVFINVVVEYLLDPTGFRQIWPCASLRSIQTFLSSAFRLMTTAASSGATSPKADPGHLGHQNRRQKG
jgi:hypothetical protein